MTRLNSMREFLKYKPSGKVLDYIARTKHKEQAHKKTEPVCLDKNIIRLFSHVCK